MLVTLSLPLSSDLLTQVVERSLLYDADEHSYCGGDNDGKHVRYPSSGASNAEERCQLGSCFAANCQSVA